MRFCLSEDLARGSPVHLVAIGLVRVDLFRRSIRTEVEGIAAHGQPRVEFIRRSVDRDPQIHRRLKTTAQPPGAIQVEPALASGPIRGKVDEVPKGTDYRSTFVERSIQGVDRSGLSHALIGNRRRVKVIRAVIQILTNGPRPGVGVRLIGVRLPGPIGGEIQRGPVRRKGRPVVVELGIDQGAEVGGFAEAGPSVETTADDPEIVTSDTSRPVAVEI